MVVCLAGAGVAADPLELVGGGGQGELLAALASYEAAPSN